MSYTNAQVLRREIGDGGIPARDVTSGDGASTEFYLSSVPIIGASQLVIVGTTPYAEVPSAPGAGQYTLDDLTGRLVFGVAPLAGTGNVITTYLSCYMPDGDVAEVLRLYGLDAAASADVGPSATLLAAAETACQWVATSRAYEYDVTVDGQSLSRSSVAERFQQRADAIRVRLDRSSSLDSLPITRIDGYSIKGEYSSRDIASVGQNPRRRYYGEPDRLP